MLDPQTSSELMEKVIAYEHLIDQLESFITQQQKTIDGLKRQLKDQFFTKKNEIQ